MPVIIWVVPLEQVLLFHGCITPFSRLPSGSLHSFIRAVTRQSFEVETITTRGFLQWRCQRCMKVKALHPPPASGSLSWTLCQLPAWLSAEFPVPENPLAMCQRCWKAENCSVGFQSCFFQFGNLKMHRSNMTISSQWRSVFCTLKQKSSTFLAPGAGFVEDNFSMDWEQGRRWFRDDSCASHLLCTLFVLLLHQLHLRSPDSRFWRLGTPAVGSCVSWRCLVYVIFSGFHFHSILVWWS